MSPFVAAAAVLGLWAAGMAFLASDAKKRGRLGELRAPRGYIRKPKGPKPIDEAAFWREARKDADETIKLEVMVAKAQLKAPARRDAEAEFRKTEAEFWASVRRPKEKLSNDEQRLRQLRKRIAEAEARGDLIEAKRLSSEARFIVTAQQNRQDDAEERPTSYMGRRTGA